MSVSEVRKKLMENRKSAKRLKSLNSNIENSNLPNCDSSCIGFFSGISIYVLPTGIGKLRRALFEKQALKNGGTVDHCITERTTHVIVDESVGEDKIFNLLNWESHPSGIKVVRTKWFSSCIEDSNCVDSEQYEVSLQKSITSYSSKKRFSESSTVSAAENKQEIKVESPVETISAALLAPVPKVKRATWICSIPSGEHSVNYNKIITDKLEVLCETYKNTKDHWRAVGYEKGIIALKNYPKCVESWEEAKSIKGIGEKLADKVWEIIQSGHLRKIDEVCSEKKVESINLFVKVWGIGPSTAEMFVNQGLYTLEDLKNKAKLTKAQKIGLKYFEDIQSRMPRSESAEIITLVKVAVVAVDRNLISVACGSYRRGRQTCGDVDILITHPDGKSHINILTRIVSKLHDTGLLTDDLVSQEDNGNQKKYMGICKLPHGSQHRRIDIIVVPVEEYACALMHFTGSAHFNRSIRLLASKKDMSLSEHSLRAGVVRRGQEKISDGYVIDTPTEETIFKHLGLSYLQPEDRDHFAIE